MKATMAAVVMPLALCLAGCDLGLGQREARRTMVGITPDQVARASQRVLVDEGFDLAQVFPREGNLRTAWRERPRIRLAYAVNTSPFIDEDGKAIPGAFTLTVACTAQDRLVGGWSEEYASGHRTRAILREISRLLLETPPPVRRVVRSEPSPPAAEPPPAEPPAESDEDATGTEPAEEEVSP